MGASGSTISGKVVTDDVERGSTGCVDFEQPEIVFDALGEDDEDRVRRSFFTSSSKSTASSLLQRKDFFLMRNALRTLCGSSAAPDASDVFWFELGNAFGEPLTSVDERALDAALRPLSQELYAHYAHSGGLYKLARHASLQLAVAGSNAHTVPVGAINVTVLVSVFFKHFIEFTASMKHGKDARAARVDEFRALCRFNADWESGSIQASSSLSSSSSPFSDILKSCVDVLSKRRVTASTMALHVSCVRLLLVALSSQLVYDVNDEDMRRMGHPLASLLRVLGDEDDVVSGSLVCALLNQIAAREVNSGDIYDRSVHGASGGSRNGARGLISSLLSFNKSSSKSSSTAHNDYNDGATPMKTTLRIEPSPLADECANLLLALCTHSALGTIESNPFRSALGCVKDVSARASVVSSRREATLVDFEQLTKTLCSLVSTDKGLLVLYTVLVSTPRFIAHLASTMEYAADLLLQNVLRELYDATTAAHEDVEQKLQITTAIVLMLTSDVAFMRRVQSMYNSNAGSVEYYKDRILRQTSLASLLIIVCSRAIDYRVSSRQSSAATSLNALGAMANVSRVVQGISNYAAQRLVNVLALFTRRYSRLLLKLRDDGDSCDLKKEANVFEDFIRIVFETLNGLVVDAESLRLNPEIVYALMHREDLFSAYRTHETFAEYVQNIEGVLRTYHEAIDDAQENDCSSPISVGSLKRIIADIDRSAGEVVVKHEFYPMRLAYAEDDERTLIFLAVYSWCCISITSGVLWHPRVLALFHFAS